MAWFHRLVFSAPLFVGLGLTGVAIAAQDVSAQSNQDWFRGQPLQPPDSGPAGTVNTATTGRDFGGPNMPPPVAPPPAQPHGAQGGPAFGGQSDFPGDAVHDWVVASARTAHARATLHRAEDDLDHTVRDAQLTFEQSREYTEALAAEKQAYQAYTAERQRALKSVIDDPKYVAALELRDKMGDQIAHLRAESKRAGVAAPRELLLAMASQKMLFATDAHNLEAAALDKDDALKDARQKLVQASARVAALRANFDASVRSNPQILMARRNLEDARVALITSEAYFNAATLAAGVATDSFYYRHRWDGLAAPQFVWGPYGY